MSDFDLAAVNAVHGALKRRVERYEFRKTRIDPLMESMTDAMKKLTQAALHEAELEPRVRALKALVTMEARLRSLPTEATREEIEREKVLAAAPLKTASLQQLLEDVP